VGVSGIALRIGLEEAALSVRTPPILHAPTDQGCFTCAAERLAFVLLRLRSIDHPGIPAGTDLVLQILIEDSWFSPQLVMSNAMTTTTP
jgi:hypothetical protein